MVAPRRVIGLFLVSIVALALSAAGTRAADAPDSCRKPPAAEPAKKTADSAAAEAKKKREEAAQKAMEEAQRAYEKEKRELQERLSKDPQWQAAYEQAGVISVTADAPDCSVNSFCLNAAGELLVCCQRKAKGDGQDAAPASGMILRYDPQGKKLGEWKSPVAPQGICVAADGTIYVGGAGKLCKLDATGKVLATGDAPNLAEVPPLPPEPPKEAAPQGKAAEEAKQAKQKAIAKLRKELAEAQQALEKLSEEAGKDFDPNNDAAMAAFRAKIAEPMQKAADLEEKLEDLQTTPQQRRARLRWEHEYRLTITGMAVTGQDLFVACMSGKGYGYNVWRTDHDFAHRKKIVENLGGCCGQMDIQARAGEVWVAHNGRHRVEHYLREGKKLGSFGKADRTSADGFGGCCEPKNLRFAPNGDLFACESGPPTCVKRFTPAGKFLGVMLVAPWDSGCVRVTTEYQPRSDTFYVLNSDAQAIHWFTKKKAAPAAAQTADVKGGT